MEYLRSGSGLLRVGLGKGSVRACLKQQSAARSCAVPREYSSGPPMQVGNITLADASPLGRATQPIVPATVTPVGLSGSSADRAVFLLAQRLALCVLVFIYSQLPWYIAIGCWYLSSRMVCIRQLLPPED
jgi:hypothetical protein